MNSSESEDSIRTDLRPQMWQLTSVVVCCGLVPAVAYVPLVVAIYGMGEKGENGVGGIVG